MKPRIPYTKPSITELEVRYVTDAAANGWGERCYAYIERFENSFKTHLGGQARDRHVELHKLPQPTKGSTFPAGGFPSQR